MLDDASIEAWIAENEPGGLNKLDSAHRMGKFQGQRAVIVGDYLHRHQAFLQGLAEVEAVTRELRAITAAERSAKWSGWAIAVSLASLAVSAAALLYSIYK